MMKTQIIVSDANVFVDLLSVGLLEAFFMLTSAGYEICTTDLVFHEVRCLSKERVLEKFKKKGVLKIADFSSSEMCSIASIKANSPNNTSLADVTGFG